MFHIRDEALCAQILFGVLGPYLADTAKTRLLQPGGDYLRAHHLAHRNGSRNGMHFNVQQFLIDHVEGRETLDAVPLPRFLKNFEAED